MVSRCRSCRSAACSVPWAMPAAKSVSPFSRIALASSTASTFGGHVLLDARLLLQPRQDLLDGLEVGEDQLGVDGLDVVLGRDLAVDVDDVLVLEGADDLADRVGLADVREELVAQALTLAGAPDDARDVDEVDGGGEDLLRGEDLRELGQPRVGDADDADVRLDGGERVVGRQHVVLGQGVEQGRLADIRQADDSDRERHVATFRSEEVVAVGAVPEGPIHQSTGRPDPCRRHRPAHRRPGRAERRRARPKARVPNRLIPLSGLPLTSGATRSAHPQHSPPRSARRPRARTPGSRAPRRQWPPIPTTTSSPRCGPPGSRPCRRPHAAVRRGARSGAAGPPVRPAAPRPARARPGPAAGHGVLDRLPGAAARPALPPLARPAAPDAGGQADRSGLLAAGGAGAAGLRLSGPAAVRRRAGRVRRLYLLVGAAAALWVRPHDLVIAPVTAADRLHARCAAPPARRGRVRRAC